MIRVHQHLFRSPPLASLAAALAALAGCAAPDPTNFSCSSSAECPSGYHCNLGTASTAGTLKCASGAPQQKTLSADATRFLLARRPNADGTVRATLSAGMGAVTSTPDFVGVRVIAKLGTADVAQSTVLADGSVLQFQIPDVNGALSFRVQDDSGHSVAVTGYRQEIELSFAGKDVTGNLNPLKAYDASTATDSLYEPSGWIQGLTEIPVSSPVTNNVASPAAYNGLVAVDGILSSTTAPAQPRATGAIGWEQIASAATDTNSGFVPSARNGMAVADIGNGMTIIGARSYPILAFGGLDASGAPADSTPTVYAFDPDNVFAGLSGWATVETNTQLSTPGPFPSNGAPFGLASPVQLATISKAGSTLAPGGSYNCTTGACAGINYALNLVAAGGVKADGTPTNNLFAYGSRTIGGNIYLGWWDLTAEAASMGTVQPRLLTANTGMASAVLYNIPVPSGTSQATYSGVVMVGGQGITPGSSGNNDTAACQYLTTFGSANPTFQVSSCATAQWATAALLNNIGFRTGEALTASDDSTEGATVYLFGGNRSGGPTGTSGLQNDVWKGSISVVCSVGPPATPPCTAVGAAAQTQISWTQLSTAGTAPATKPSPRTGAAIAFDEFRKLIVYGGTDTSGPQQDAWELDLSASAPVPYPWRKLSFDASPALAPQTRTRAVLVGPTSFVSSGNAVLLFGGSVGTAATDEVWALSRQSASRLLIAAPAGLASPDTAVNMTLTVRNFSSIFGAPVYLWNPGNARWDVIGEPLLGPSFSTVLDPLPYLHPDGSFYFLLNSRSRSTPSFSNANNVVATDGLTATLNFE